MSDPILAAFRHGTVKGLAERGAQGNRQTAVSFQGPVNLATSLLKEMSTYFLTGSSQTDPTSTLMCVQMDIGSRLFITRL